MSSPPPIQPDPGPGADPVATALRLRMTRRLLVTAVRRYQLTLAFTEEIDDAIPVPFRPPFDPDAEPEEERRAWWIMLREAEADFYAAEVALAERIANLYDELAPDGRRIGPRSPGSAFAERGVSLDGTVYILMDDPSNFEPGTNIIAAVSGDRVIGLDG